VTEDKATPAARGRPRSEAAGSAIIQAVLELLAEGGVQALTMEGVAARAGVAKTTVYRRWRSRADLLLVGARHLKATGSVRPSGDLERDLIALAREIVRVLDRPLARRVIPRLLADAREDPEVAAGLRDFWAERRTLVLDLLADGVGRGELRSDLDLEHAADAMYGPIYYRYLVTGAPLDALVAERVVGLALNGMRRDDGVLRDVAVDDGDNLRSVAFRKSRA
jgi:AcrR family transcriptional regulator